MNDAEGMNFKVSIPTDREPAKVGKSRSYRHSNPNLEDIIKFIGGLSVPSRDKDTLVKVARRVPHGALASFRDNYVNYLKKEGGL